MLSIINWYFLFTTLSLASALASTSRNWPLPRPWPQSPGLGLGFGLRTLAASSVSASRFWLRLTSLHFEATVFYPTPCLDGHNAIFCLSVVVEITVFELAMVDSPRHRPTVEKTKAFRLSFCWCVGLWRQYSPIYSADVKMWTCLSY